MTKGEVSFQAYGYHLDAIKPVHLANGFFLALTGTHYRLEWLNKLAVVSHKKGLHGDYQASALRHILANEKMAIRPDLGDQTFSQLRLQANAILSNDDAVYAAFDRYSAFGNDYTVSSPEFLCDQKRKDGYAGYFIYSILNATATGRKIIEISRSEFESEGDSLVKLFRPLLDSAESGIEWENEYEVKLGVLTSERITEIASLMEGTTEGILQLIQTSQAFESRYSLLRQLITALGIWLSLYLIRQSSAAAGIGESALLFSDFTGNASRKCRARSIHCFSRHRELIYRSFHAWLESGKISTLEPYLKNGRVDLKDVERHFQDLAVRVGLAQPRASNARSKHYEPQPDTVRTLAMSLLSPEEGPVTFQDFANRLRSVWGIALGGCDDDVARLAEEGIIGLDEDDDLSLNRRCFITQLKMLDLAYEPSDGLVLCEVKGQDVR